MGSSLNGKGHAITTLVVSVIIAKMLSGWGVSSVIGTMFVIGSFLTCHSADVWGISAISPDADLMFERKFGLRIHRKWYFHSFILSLPFMWVGTSFISVNNSLASLFMGMAFGWNAHIIEDDFWSRWHSHKKQPFPVWVEFTSLMTLGLAVLGILAIAHPSIYYHKFHSLYYVFALGFIPEHFGLGKLITGYLKMS